MAELASLRAAVDAHSGVFHCVEIHREQNTKSIGFRHLGLPPSSSSDMNLPDVRGLRDFYATFAQLTLYVDERSGDAAFFIAPPAQWPELDAEFRPWLEGIGGDEADDFLPPWINDCLVIGEIPRSGNYLLVPVAGPEAGKVFEFEHDGFEFVEQGDSVADFVMRTLDLDTRRLTGIASHIRFITPGEGCQWWISEMQDSRGNSVRTGM